MIRHAWAFNINLPIYKFCQHYCSCLYVHINKQELYYQQVNSNCVIFIINEKNYVLAAAMSALRSNEGILSDARVSLTYCLLGQFNMSLDNNVIVVPVCPLYGD